MALPEGHCKAILTLIDYLAEGEIDHWCEAPMVFTAEGGGVWVVVRVRAVRNWHPRRVIVSPHLNAHYETAEGGLVSCHRRRR